MIIIDTSIWVDHFRRNDAHLVALLEGSRVLVHDFVQGELALGNLRQRKQVIEALADLPRAEHATPEEVLAFIERHALHGAGIGYVDAHLLAASKLNAALLWTKDRYLYAVASRLKLAYVP